MAYSPWGCKESDTTEQLTLYLEGRFQLKFAFCIWIPVGPTPFVENTAICLLTAFTPLSESLGHVCVVYCWMPCFLPLIYVSMLPWSPCHTVLILQLCGGSLWLLQGYPFPELFWIDYFGPLPCCKIFKSSLSISTKKSYYFDWNWAKFISVLGRLTSWLCWVSQSVNTVHPLFT